MGVYQSTCLSCGVGIRWFSGGEQRCFNCITRDNQTTLPYKASDGTGSSHAPISARDIILPDFDELVERVEKLEKRLQALEKKPVSSSHLALRFYKHCGWTKEILEKYLIRGAVKDQAEGQEVRDYWWLDHTQNSCLDMKRLLDEQVSQVIRWYDGPPRETDLEYLEKFNWN